MVGNIFARFKNDIDTATSYYHEALRLNPKDYISITNLGTNLLHLGKWEQGLDFLRKAHGINPDFPNTNFSLALAYDHQGETLEAFFSSLNALKHCGVHDRPLFENAAKTAMKTAKELVATSAGRDVVDRYKSALETEGEKAVKVTPDTAITTAAKLEIAESYERDYHLVRYSESYQGVEHLIMHELVHLDFILQARKAGCNKLFTTTPDKRQEFMKLFAKTRTLMLKRGDAEETVNGYVTSLFHGINNQLYNTPIDLFIEDLLFDRFPTLRPFQFISLFGLINEGMRAVTSPVATRFVPDEIFSASMVFNLLNAMQFRSLFGIDLVQDFNAAPSELKKAKSLFGQFNNLRKKRTPGKEYQLIRQWGTELNLTPFFELIDENDHHRHLFDSETLLTAIENDPYGLENIDEIKEQEMQTFLNTAKKKGLNRDIITAMVEALKHFDKTPTEKIQSTAMEIALMGSQGIRGDNNKSYNLQNIPNRDFTGIQLLAYYYVSFALAFPDLLTQLQLPYGLEYEVATQLIQSKP